MWQGQQGWTLSPAYDINPTPADVKPRILSTNIDFDDSTCSVELLPSVAGAVQNWRGFARGRGAREAKITRMASAFEHDDPERALALP